MLCQHFSLKLLLGIGTNNENEICKVYVQIFTTNHIKSNYLLILVNN